MNIKISKLRLLEHERLKAVVSLLVEDHLAIHDIKVIQLKDKTIVAMPSQPDKKGQYRDVVHPISQELREEISSLILDEYRRQSSSQHNVNAKIS